MLWKALETHKLTRMLKRYSEGRLLDGDERMAMDSGEHLWKGTGKFNRFRTPRLDYSDMEADGWRVVDDDDYRQAVGEPQAEGMMSIAASFSLS
jgi:hypothetical protein